MADASIGLTTVAETGSMHIRNWFVPEALADRFAAQMTARFGEPEEMITDLETMEAGGRRAAAEGRAVFMLDPEGGRNG
jgi:hypothetical protein